MLTTNRLQKRKHATVFEPEFEPEGNILKLPTLHDHDDASGFMLLRETAQKFQDSNDFALDIDSPAAQSGNYAGHTRRLSGVSQDISSPAKKTDAMHVLQSFWTQHTNMQKSHTDLQLA
jgi:hypothetical protein